MTNLENLEREARRFTNDTVLQFKENCNNDDVEYWQGRKDATRLMLAIILDNIGQSGDKLRSLVESSPNSQVFDYELANNMLADAVYNISAALYELSESGHLDIRTKLNLKNFVASYDAYSKLGKFPVIEDHC